MYVTPLLEVVANGNSVDIYYRQGNELHPVGHMHDLPGHHSTYHLAQGIRRKCIDPGLALKLKNTVSDVVVKNLKALSGIYVPFNAEKTPVFNLSFRKSLSEPPLFREIMRIDVKTNTMRRY